MRPRLLVLLAATSCGHPVPAPVKTRVSALSADAAVARPQAPVPTVHRARDVVEAPPAGGIAALAATPDGRSVLSIDDLGGARLWPTLDGTKEPRVVELPGGAHDIALGRRDDGYTAVVRDEVGGLYLARLDEDGRTRSHVTLGGDAAFDGLAMTVAGTLAWRADQRLLLIDGDGRVVGDLAAEAQQRIVLASASNDHVVALLEVDGGLQARRVTLRPTLAWGPWIDVTLAGGAPFALAVAPDGRHVAVATRVDTATNLHIVDAGGALVTTASVRAAEVDVVFDGPDRVAFATADGDSWLSVAKDAAPVAMQVGSDRHVLAAGDRQLIRARASELLLARPAGTGYLGYQTLAPILAGRGPNGGLLVAGTPSTVLLDASLQEAGAPDLGASGTDIADLEWVGGDDYLVESATGGQRGTLALVDGASGTKRVVRTGLEDISYLSYEPSTDLVTMSFGSQAQVAVLDRKARTLDALTPPRKRASSEEVVYVPTSPALPRGTRVVEIGMRDALTLRWFKGAPGKDAHVASVSVPGAYLGADASGRVYAWRTRSDGRIEAAIYADGTQVGTLPVQGPVSLWPSADGTAVVAATATTLTLYRDGAESWTRSLENAHEVHWLTDGALAVVHPSGIARLDTASGNVTAMRCGWQFGLTAVAHPASPAIASLCTQLMR